MKAFRLMLVALTMGFLVTTWSNDAMGIVNLDDLHRELEDLEFYQADVINAAIALMQINFDGAHDDLIMDLLDEADSVQQEIDRVQSQIDSYQPPEPLTREPISHDTVLRGRRLGQLPGRG